jgi:hypothetical protein
MIFDINEQSCSSKHRQHRYLQPCGGGGAMGHVLTEVLLLGIAARKGIVQQILRGFNNKLK